MEDDNATELTDHVQDPNDRNAYNEQLNRVIEEFSPTIETVDVAAGVEFNNTLNQIQLFESCTWPAYLVPFVDPKKLGPAIYISKQPPLLKGDLESLGWTQKSPAQFNQETCQPLEEHTIHYYQMENPDKTRCPTKELLVGLGKNLSNTLPDTPSEAKLEEAQLWSTGDVPPSYQQQPYFVWMAENNPDWASCQAFHCYVPLGSQGCTISVGKISESTKNQLLQMKTTKGVTDSLLYGIEEIRLLKNHLSLHVPRGAALFLDAREFTCGVNVQKDHPTLFGIFSLAGAPLETTRRPVFLRTYLSYPSQTVEGSRSYQTPICRYEYNQELDKYPQCYLTFTPDWDNKSLSAFLCNKQEPSSNHVVEASAMMIAWKKTTNMQILHSTSRDELNPFQNQKELTGLVVFVGKNCPSHQDAQVYIHRIRPQQDGDIYTSDLTTFVSHLKFTAYETQDSVTLWSPKREQCTTLSLPPLTLSWLQNITRTVWKHIPQPTQTQQTKASKELLSALSFPPDEQNIHFEDLVVGLYRSPCPNSEQFLDCQAALFVPLHHKVHIELNCHNDEQNNTESDCLEPPKKKQKSSVGTLGKDGHNEEQPKDSAYFLIISYMISSSN